ncbi:hypothetical protein CCM_07555 [Cordyceps militaris CM01]|uniref:Uncharacterized protein n=1 Tax=Cordyceps militaris (strain CM01) TaxID=983644 RepID=G3JQ53_CORMM|nr:uncharacterized protein CCM_07555 [Cordyceps militaris CM01]EGX89304.1 hypothetical protein CCM_07555 [Cordyceps militaris CM01]
MGKLPKEQEAPAEQSAGPELPPPEYAAAADSAPDTPPPGYTPGPSPYQTVPISWNLYSKPYSRRAFHLGPHAAAPVYSLELHTGLLSSRPFLVLRPGRDTTTTTKTSSSPPLATARRDAPRHTTITVVPGTSERLTVHARRLTFSFDVGADPRREAFEWRKEKRRWALVHLAAHGDAHPVVAVFAEDSSRSGTELARFRFVGAGATDAFGEPWALYVSMTALRIWEMMLGAGTTV